MGGGRPSTPPTRMSEQSGDPNPETLRSPTPGLPALGDIVAQRWRIDAVVGSGGMAHVFAAFDLSRGEDVAFKVLEPELADDPEAVERYAREARALAALTTDHVVRIRDVGKLANGIPFLTMELLRGHDLGHVLAARGPLPILDACDYLEQACEALDEAHGKGLVHRDLKPGNLFLTHQGGKAIIRVLDFGIARVLGGKAGKLATITRVGTLVGTITYMAPEQIRSSHRVDARADIWALGACLYKLLTGKAPFTALNETSLVEVIDGHPPTPLGDHRPDIPPLLAGVVFRCLRKNPEERYPNVSALRMALADARSAIVHSPPRSAGTEAMAPLSPGVPRPSSPPGFGGTKRLDELVHGATAPIDPSQLPPAFHASGPRSGMPSVPFSAAVVAPRVRRMPPALIAVVILLVVLALFALGAGGVFFFLR